MASRPIVLEAMDVHSFLQYVLNHHATTSTIVVCSSKTTFIQALQAAWPQDPLEDQSEPSSRRTQGRDLHASVRLTLRQLASFRTLKLTFCSDVVQLRAYLAVYGGKQAEEPTPNFVPTSIEPKTSVLGLLNPIELHRPTSGFSAQGLNRTFAAAVEAARRTSCRLIIAECPIEPLGQAANYGNDEMTQTAGIGAVPSPWDQDISILNVATKSFGAGERGWVGRTVKVRSIAARWCRFEPVSMEEPA